MFQTCMGTVGDASAAVDADKGLCGCIKVDRINRTGLCACAAADAELLFHHYAPALSLGIRAGRTGRYAGCRVAGQTKPCLKSRREAPRGPYTDSRCVTRQPFMYKPCTGK